MAEEQTVQELAIQIKVLEDNTQKKIEAIADSINKLKRGTDNAAKGTSLWSKALRSVARIGFYRIIRAGIKDLTKLFSDGLKNLRTENKELDKSLNGISLSLQTLGNSLAVLITPFVNLITPAITRITDGVANFANGLSEAQAALKGDAKYTRILTSDTKEYQKQLEKANGSLLDFDKFTALKGGGYTGVTSSTVSMDIDEAEKRTSTLYSVIKVLRDIGNAIKDIWEGIIKPVFQGIAKAIKWLSDNDMLTPILEGLLILFVAIKAPIVAIVSGIALLIKGWDKLSTAGKVMIPVLAGVVAAIAAVAVAMAGLGFGAALKAAAIVGGIALVSLAAMNLKSYANGGVYEKGDFLKANENGKTELIASTNTGGGAVMNLQQWEKVSESAFYSALNRHGAAQGNGGGTVVLDGRRVGELVENSVYNEGVRVGHWSRG